MKNPQEGQSKSSQRMGNAKVFVDQSARSSIGVQEIFAVLFGILGGGAYCVFTKQLAQKKAIVFLLSSIFSFITVVIPFQQQSTEYQESIPTKSPNASTSQSETENEDYSGQAENEDYSGQTENEDYPGQTENIEKFGRDRYEALEECQNQKIAEGASAQEIVESCNPSRF
jgi:hypothetical protein